MWPDSRCSRVSPMQAMTLRPWLCAYSHFCPTSSSSSRHSERRSAAGGAGSRYQEISYAAPRLDEQQPPTHTTHTYARRPLSGSSWAASNDCCTGGADANAWR